MIYPQLALSTEATSLESFINDDSWVMEQKLDGHRVLLVAPGADMAPTALTRNGSLYSRRLPRAIQNFRFPEGEWVLDGELVGSRLWLFDMPKSPITAEGTPLYQRRVALGTLLKNTINPFDLVPQARTAGEKIKLAEVALKNNLEGLVLKKAESPYRSGGRTPEWLKLKFVSTADCIVLDVRDDGKESVRLGMCADGDLRATCDVGRASLIGKEKAGAINVGDVIEVRYLYAGAGGRLYQPTILRKRDDKRPEECTIDQMKHVNKEVLEAL